MIPRPTPAPDDLTTRRRAARLADLLARIAQAVPPRVDELRYPRGHHWTRRREHEAMVLRVVARRCDAVSGRAV